LPLIGTDRLVPTREHGNQTLKRTAADYSTWNILRAWRRRTMPRGIFGGVKAANYSTWNILARPGRSGPASAGQPCWFAAMGAYPALMQYAMIMGGRYSW